MPPKNRAAFYIAVMRHLWNGSVVPKPAELADWIEAQKFIDPPPDLPTLLERLRLWPPDKPYPPLPDDDALSEGVNKPDPRWWVPGSTPSSIGKRAVRKVINPPDDSLEGAIDVCPGETEPDF